MWEVHQLIFIAMVYTRAEDHQINAWEEAVNAGWN